ncbi:hypothetical protein SEA_ANNIHILUS_38 [Streptomyces phage Annihilus]|nr:hypothetical protein SEA_MOOZY_37 [Streptomyces phage Moozy]UQT02485.1 hypothetical protein SEA_ANNIHILUS_38 [Streptomyces phage Annihilus]
MEEFPSNSIEQSTTPKVRRPLPSDDAPEVQSPAGGEKVIKKIVKGGAIKRKKTLGSRFREAIGGKDGQSITDYLMTEVLGPAFKDMITDAVIQGVERMVYGEAQHSSRRTANRRGPIGSTNHISYNRYSTTPRETAGPRMSSRGRASHDFGEIELRTRAQAEATIAQMQEFIDRFGHTSVADLYEMVDLDAEFTDEKWGWHDLYGADVRRTRSGTYILILPRTEPIG